MKAILINPHLKTIEEVELTEPTLQGMYRLIDCSLVECLRVAKRNDLWIDEEGLYVEDQAYFYWEGYPGPIAGRGLVTGNDEKGDTVGTTMSVDGVRSKVRFRD